MDLEASTDLAALLQLVAPVITGHWEISIGGRRHLKALRANVAKRLVREVVNRSWLFDAELLARAERAGFRIARLPSN